MKKIKLYSSMTKKESKKKRDMLYLD